MKKNKLFNISICIVALSAMFFSVTNFTNNYTPVNSGTVSNAQYVPNPGCGPLCEGGYIPQ